MITKYKNKYNFARGQIANEEQKRYINQKLEALCYIFDGKQNS